MNNDIKQQEIVAVLRELVEVVHKFVHRIRIMEDQGSDTTFPDMEEALTLLTARLERLTSEL